MHDCKVAAYIVIMTGLERSFAIMKRFVSYLYSIYNNQKIHNAGFARIELRTGRNRVDIHLKENGYAGKTGTVYLFVRKQENIQGISIGNITFRNNQADFRYEQAEENIGQTPWQIMQMGGILIVVDDRAAFLSQWDEQPVDTARFEVWDGAEAERVYASTDQSGNGNVGASADKSGAGYTDASAGKAEAGDVGAFAGKAETGDVGVSVGKAETGNIGVSVGKAETMFAGKQEIGGTDAFAGKPEDGDVDASLGKQGIGNTGTAVGEPGTEGIGTAVGEPGTEGIGVSVGKSEAGRDGASVDPSGAGNVDAFAGVGVGGNGVSADRPKAENIDASIRTGAESISASGRLSDIRTAELQPQPKAQWNQTWRHMLRMYPVLDQFTDKNNVLCIRIEIKDVRLLPEKYWSMVNNSFLLHGFFNYRHLAFGRVDQNWFIGVPGIYQHQEHVMASIFGFPDFLPQKQKNERGGQPGYWYRVLEI